MEQKHQLQEAIPRQGRSRMRDSGRWRSDAWRRASAAREVGPPACRCSAAASCPRSSRAGRPAARTGAGTPPGTTIASTTTTAPRRRVWTTTTITTRAYRPVAPVAPGRGDPRRRHHRRAVGDPRLHPRGPRSTRGSTRDSRRRRPWQR